MENTCRLCANVKSSRQLTCSIEDETLNVIQKLIDCCRWNSIGGNEYQNLPQKICNTCYRQLEECWEFAERVAQAQQRLQAQFVETKPEVHFQSCLLIENGPQEEFKDDVKAPLNTYDYGHDSIMTHEFIVSTPTEKDNEYLKIDDSKPTITDRIVNSNSTSPETICYLCETCGKIFNSKSNLMTHTKMHLPLENRNHFECYICKTTFSYKKSLTHHMPIHWGQKIQYQCNVCGLKFSRTDALRRHSLIHLGKQPHLCQTCGKGFRTKFNLKTHERTHTGERPYACTYCCYRSSFGQNLGKHIKQKHKDQWKQSVVLHQVNS